MGAMEAALVCGILKILGTKLAPLVTKELSSIAGITKDIEILQDLVGYINEWLEKVGHEAIGTEKSSNWLKRLKDAAYDAEDLVHELHMEAEKLDENVVGNSNVMVKYLWRKPKSAVFKCKIAYKIKEIKKRFNAIVKERSDYSRITNSISVDHHAPHISKTIGEVPSLTNVDETSIFGRNQLKLQLISKLIETNGLQKIKIVSVIGLGGSGKTTVAKLVYNDDNTIHEYFEVKLWVHVSREFAVEKLVEKLYEAIDGDKANHHSSQRMGRTISNKLAGKKFLLVLDDVWTEDRLQWEQFMVNIRGGAPDSSILLTTRNRKVAEAVDSTFVCDLPCLSEDYSWKVFLQSFGRGMEALDPEFQQVGTEIVKKCGGVPLAIKVLGGVLRGMKRIEQWQSIRDTNLLDVKDEQHRVSNCLFLSYVHLPYHLKQCFTHCSIFPRGYVINRRHLISQWIVHGFIDLTNQALQPEDIGIDYFESLLNVGFLQDLEECQTLFGEETTCKMHDLLHDLSRQILHDEFVSGIAASDQIKRCRYLSLTSLTREVDRKLFDKVRAFYILRGNITFNKPMNKRCCVRTVILDRIKAASLPLFVSNFEHLGYLQISHVSCEALPEVISHCWNLQSIHVIDCRRLAALPESIGKLKKLRTLELTHCQEISTLPQSIGCCENLQSIYLSQCGFEDIPNSIGNIKSLRILAIHCFFLEQWSSSESFGQLCNLRTIKLNWCMLLERLPQCITLLTHLEYLDLTECGELVELPEGIGNLKRLQVLNLHGCHKLCGLPAGLGQLTRLRKLGLFVVGGSTNHARISELEDLDKLNGELDITNINYVNDPCDAEKVHLKRKNGIRKLSLDWYLRGNSRAREALEESDSVEVVRTKKEILLDMEKDLYLLNNLEPPTEIEKLRVGGYRGFQLPCWMMKQSGSCDLDGLHTPEQSNPPQFYHLTKLVLDNLSNLEHLQGLVDLPGIKIIKLKKMPKLLELLTARTCLESGKEETEVQNCFPHLSYLVISDCPKLMVKPHFPSSLQRLTLDQSNEQLLSSGSFFLPRHAHGDEPASSSCTVDVKPSHLTELKLKRLIQSSFGWDALRHLTGLQILKINECKDLRQLPESMGSLTSLIRLDIGDCDNLCMLPEWLGELQFLQSLKIEDTPKLSILPQSIQHLTALKTLNIKSCKALHRLPERFGQLCSLSFLIMTDLPALTCLPESMQRLTSLEDLHLTDCDALTQLPELLGEISALRTLWIKRCRGLTSLPLSIRHSSLEMLEIKDCPELVRRCKEGVGEDWHLVSHIPDLRLEE